MICFGCGEGDAEVTEWLPPSPYEGAPFRRLVFRHGNRFACTADFTIDREMSE